jgi:protein Mpv17
MPGNPNPFTSDIHVVTTEADPLLTKYDESEHNKIDSSLIFDENINDKPFTSGRSCDRMIMNYWSILLVISLLTAFAILVRFFELDETEGAVINDEDIDIALKDVTDILKEVPMSLWDSYMMYLNRHPILCKSFTSGFVYTLGDILAQVNEEQTKLDRPRTLRSLVAGFCGHGPMSHFWYLSIQYLFDTLLGWTAWWSLFPKILLDQTVFSLVWNNTYILILGIMKYDAPYIIWNDMKRLTMPLIVSGLKFWPFVHIITYGVIPVENRTLFVDAVEIVWVVILSTQAAAVEKEGTISDYKEIDDSEEEVTNLLNLERGEIQGDHKYGYQQKRRSTSSIILHQLGFPLEHILEEDEYRLDPSSGRRSSQYILQHRRDSLGQLQKRRSMTDRTTKKETQPLGHYVAGQVLVL